VSGEGEELAEVGRALAAGREAYAREDLDAAERHFRQGLASAPEHPWLNSVLGVVLSAKGLSVEASDRLRRAAEISGYSDPLIVSNLVTFLLTMPVDAERLETAEQALRQALGSDGLAISRAQLGWVLELQGRSREARAEYLQALRRPLGFPHEEGKADLGEWYELALAGLLRTTLSLTGLRVVVQARPQQRREEKLASAMKVRVGRAWGNYLEPNIAWFVTVGGLGFGVAAHILDLLPSGVVGLVVFFSFAPPMLVYARRHYKRIKFGPGGVEAVPRQETPRTYVTGSERET
jgi:tetratricopeptide (TPR) repeat protein